MANCSSRRKALTSSGEKKIPTDRLLLVFSHHITPRLQYVIDYLNEKMNWQAVITDDLMLFKAHHSEKINYSTQRLATDELFIYA